MTKVQIRDLALEKTVMATVRERLTQRELARIDAKWERFQERAERAGVVPEHNRWRFADKIEDPRWSACTYLGLAYRRQIQGLLVVADAPASGRLRESLGKPTLYIEYIAAAPWNLEEYVGNQRRFGNVGRALIRCAIERSAALGFEGRLALHSLPQSEGFYERFMKTTGRDREYYALKYFEMTADEAIRWRQAT